MSYIVCKSDIFRLERTILMQRDMGERRSDCVIALGLAPPTQLIKAYRAESGLMKRLSTNQMLALT